MKLSIEQSDFVEEAEIYIKCGIIDDNLQHIIDEIYYFESVDNRTFAYCEKEVYQCSYNCTS